MQNIKTSVLSTVTQIKSDLFVLKEQIEMLETNSSSTESEAANHITILNTCHDAINQRVCLLQTMIETDSSEILDLVVPKVVTEPTPSEVV